MREDILTIFNLFLKPLEFIKLINTNGEDFFKLSNQYKTNILYLDYWILLFLKDWFLKERQLVEDISIYPSESHIKRKVIKHVYFSKISIEKRYENRIPEDLLALLYKEEDITENHNLIYILNNNLLGLNLIKETYLQNSLKAISEYWKKKLNDQDKGNINHILLAAKEIETIKPFKNIDFEISLIKPKNSPISEAIFNKLEEEGLIVKVTHKERQSTTYNYDYGPRTKDGESGEEGPFYILLFKLPSSPSSEHTENPIQKKNSEESKDTIEDNTNSNKHINPIILNKNSEFYLIFGKKAFHFKINLDKKEIYDVTFISNISTTSLLNKGYKNIEINIDRRIGEKPLISMTNFPYCSDFDKLIALYSIKNFFLVFENSNAIILLRLSYNSQYNSYKAYIICFPKNDILKVEKMLRTLEIPIYDPETAEKLEKILPHVQKLNNNGYRKNYIAEDYVIAALAINGGKIRKIENKHYAIFKKENHHKMPSYLYKNRYTNKKLSI